MPRLSQFRLVVDVIADAQLVKLFRAGGGIPMCKTGVPQTLLAFECSNPVFGTTTNPFDSSRTCGGSSGGEAALVTLRGTPIGWGSDSEYLTSPLFVLWFWTVRPIPA